VLIAACLKLVVARPEVDLLSGAVHDDTRFAGASEADRAALETALALGRRWDAPVLAVTAGTTAADTMLRDALACGASRAARVDLDPTAPSETVAHALAGVVAEATIVCCGDASLDRGSGSVPAYLAAHLGVAQLLGLVGIEAGEQPGTIRGVRRLDGGRREILHALGPAVVSLEGSVARLRRASLAATIAARTAQIEVVPGPPDGHTPHLTRPTSPMRPRARVLPAPKGEPALARIYALTAALTTAAPPETVTLAPGAAADRILSALREWGELPT